MRGDLFHRRFISRSTICRFGASPLNFIPLISGATSEPMLFLWRPVAPGVVLWVPGGRRLALLKRRVWLLPVTSASRIRLQPFLFSNSAKCSARLGPGRTQIPCSRGIGNIELNAYVFLSEFFAVVALENFDDSLAGVHNQNGMSRPCRQPWTCSSGLQGGRRGSWLLVALVQLVCPCA